MSGGCVLLRRRDGRERDGFSSCLGCGGFDGLYDRPELCREAGELYEDSESLAASSAGNTIRLRRQRIATRGQCDLYICVLPGLGDLRARAPVEEAKEY